MIMSINRSGFRKRAGSSIREILGSLALLLLTTSLLAIGLETAVRVQRGRLLSTEQARKRAALLTERPIAVHDARLGHLPTPNLSGEPWPSGARVTTDAEGIRLNGAPSPAGAPILALGDSFTFGLDVQDSETWPARLQELAGRPVLNAGVFGFGLDQIVLRAETLLDTHPDANVLVLAVFGDDIGRCEYSYLFAQKPYFEVVNGALELRNSPVPDTHAPVALAGVRHLLEYSYFADLVLTRALPSWWLVEGAKQHEHDHGYQVSVLLLDRLAAAAARRGVRLVFVSLLPSILQPEAESRLGDLTAHARELGMDAVDLREPLLAMTRSDRQRWLTRSGHFSAPANAWVAGQIAGFLR